MPLAAYLQTRRGRCTGISFVDSTTLAVCENWRIPRHKHFADLARRSKTSIGVPVQSLLDYFAGGHLLEEFLEDFPTVRREQALELLHKLKESLATAQI